MQHTVLEAIGDASLRAYVAWVPILPEDTETPDEETQALVSDARASHFWDEQRALTRIFSTLLGLPEEWPAWDVYLAYPPGARWGDAPPKPSFWHHQLGDLDLAPKLDGAPFAAGVREILQSTGSNEGG